MNGIELKARREALGLNQATLGQLLGSEQMIVAYETNQRDVPDWVETKLGALEFAQSHIAGLLLDDFFPPDIPTYSCDELFWRDWPTMKGIPATIHRSAAAQATLNLRSSGIEARIVDIEDSEQTFVQCGLCGQVTIATLVDQDPAFLTFKDSDGEPWYRNLNPLRTFCAKHLFPEDRDMTEIEQAWALPQWRVHMTV